MSGPPTLWCSCHSVSRPWANDVIKVSSAVLSAYNCRIRRAFPGILTGPVLAGQARCVASVRGAQCIVGLPAAGQALHHLILVRKFASILKLSRLFLYFFSERESIYPKLHTGYGFCPLPRSIKEVLERLLWGGSYVRCASVCISLSFFPSMPFASFWSCAIRQACRLIAPVLAAINKALPIPRALLE